MRRCCERSGVFLASLLFALSACSSEPAEDAAAKTPPAEAVPVAAADEPGAAPSGPGGRMPSERDRRLGEARKEATREALAFFRAMSDFLAAQESLSFEAEISYDSVQKTGHKLEFGSVRRMTLRRPDHLRIEAVARNGEQSTLTFDGRQLAIELEDEQAYVQVEVPGSVDAMLDHLVAALGVPVPLGDLLHSDLYGEVVDSIGAGLYVDDSRLDGRWCRHLAFAGRHSDLQLWIEEGERPLPCRLVLTYRDEPGAPQFRAELRDWKLAEETPDALFEFTPAEGAEQLTIRAVAEKARDSREVVE